MDSTRYFLDQDNSCHWYMIPVDKTDEWNKWLDLDEDNPESWDAPKFAKGLDHYGGIHFCDPQTY